MNRTGKTDWDALEEARVTGDVWHVQVTRFDPINEHWETVEHPLNGLFLDRVSAEEAALALDASEADMLRDELYPLVMVEVQPRVWMNGEPIESGYVTMSRDFLVDGSVVELRMEPDVDPHIWYDEPIVILDGRPDVARSKLVR